MFVFVAEEQGDTPDTGKCYYCVDYSAEYFAASAEQPRYKVKTEESHESPVKATDY